MTYSKKLPIVTGIIFVFVLIYCIIHQSSYEGYTVYVTAITAAASCFTGTIIWYLKKAQVENTYKLDMDCFRQKDEIELQHLEKVIQLQQKYNITDGEIDILRSKSDLDELTQQQFLKTQTTISDSYIDSKGTEADFHQ